VTRNTFHFYTLIDDHSLSNNGRQGWRFILATNALAYCGKVQISLNFCGLLPLTTAELLFVAAKMKLKIGLHIRRLRESEKGRRLLNFLEKERERERERESKCDGWR